MANSPVSATTDSVVRCLLKGVSHFSLVRSRSTPLVSPLQAAHLIAP